MSAPHRTPATWTAVVARELALRAQRRPPRRLRVVDLFAGAGGASWGATLAGCDVLAAVNHDPEMLAAHARALPWTLHLCEDLERLSPMALPAHDVLWASPECTGHTQARGKERQHHDASRGTANCPVRVADYHRAPVVVIENVAEIRKWDLFRSWLVAWDCLGYVEDSARPGASLDKAGFDPGAHGLTLNSADLGVPQARRRAFFVFRDPSRVRSPVDLSPPSAPHVPVRSVIDFDTSRGFWSRWEGLCPNTTARIRAAIERDGDTCMVAYHGSEKRGRALDAPCGVLDRNDRYRVVVGEWSRHLRVSEALAIGGFPPDYPVPSAHKFAIKAIGASVVPACATWLLDRVKAAMRFQ